MCDGNSEGLFAKGNRNLIIVFPKENFTTSRYKDFKTSQQGDFPWKIEIIKNIATKRFSWKVQRIQNVITKTFSLENTKNSTSFTLEKIQRISPLSLQNTKNTPTFIIENT